MASNRIVSIYSTPNAGRSVAAYLCKAIVMDSESTTAKIAVVA